MTSGDYETHYKTAWALLRKVMVLGTAAPADPKRSDAELAIAHFRECLSLAPHQWQCMWGIGKAKQALGDHIDALAWFERAASVEKQTVGIWQEASMEALEVGIPEKAIKYATAALSLQPNNAGLHANAALSFMLAGDDENAQRYASNALELDPNDPVNANVIKLVDAVRRGLKPRPRALNGKGQTVADT